MVAMFGFTTSLRSVTQGRASLQHGIQPLRAQEGLSLSRRMGGDTRMTPHRSAPRRIAFAKAAAFILALIPAASLAAEDLTPAFVAEHGDLLVSRVAYEGNKRTKDSVIDEIVGIRPGMRVSDLDPEVARQDLLKAGIFSDASLTAEVEDSGAAVTVRVTEKWTFLPVPSGSWGSGGWSAALFLVEFNFLGLRKTVVLEGSDSNLGWSGMLAYSDPRFLGSKTSFSGLRGLREPGEDRRIHGRVDLRRLPRDEGRRGL